ncbi:MAG: hypothetical protein A2X34_07355 [Elusimicrobia bacterium GWC2_51_8]|nr:MAG: hypothetical protein A2X33_00525 [Elusimicrobia bacterium GWA2_51_34]OGR58736.1 MAG: hypothetical protein A2X34_07355 [Elusimicrobia bacterium GWC2_51_8]OGR87624.1 MAG: hypothetical protein A2021_09220 [Elusimicrobia bacterium GWF2_52_66]HAF96355.1 zinc ABC transporter substrate-binding protein [Elusimicrobiota bacterium]HCE98541.1 zinc ABC transporter substrate-binding protein [Elusimicrobiota bacterium]
MKKIFLAITGLALWTVPAVAAIKVMTTTTDLKYLVERVGGDKVSVESISSGDQDLHFVEPKPSMVVKLRRADMLVRIGLDQDMWADSLVAAARNGKIVYGAPGYVDTSVGIKVLQVPTKKVDASMGDIHIFGNPHYWLDPDNSATMAGTIKNGLCRLDPSNAGFYAANLEKYRAELALKVKEWKEKMASVKGMKIVTYHNSWLYFAQAFGLEIVENVEPKPGIPPSPGHINSVIKTIKEKGAKYIIAETYYPLKGPRMIAEKTGAGLLTVPSSIGGLPEVKTYFEVFDCLVGKLSQ